MLPKLPTLDSMGYRVYFVDAGEYPYTQREVTGYYEPRYMKDFVVAKSRSKVRAIISNYYGLEFTYPMSIKIVPDSSADDYGRVGVIDSDPFSEAKADYINDLAHSWIDER